MIHLRRVAAAAVVLVLVTLGAAPAHAHPLGNFSVNHHDGLRISQDRIEDTAVVDSAEIPTAQDRSATDTDHDGRISRAETAARASERCTALARRIRATVDGRRLAWRAGRASLTYARGTANLPVTRLTCALRADADLSRPARVAFAAGADADLSRPARVAFAAGADAARTGWKEITAVAGPGVRLTESSAPTTSPSQVLRRYPASGTDRPLDVTGAEFRTAQGGGGAAGAAGPGPAVQAVDRGAVLFPALENRLTELTAGRDLTLPVGLFAVLLTLLLGAGHAALPATRSSRSRRAWRAAKVAYARRWPWAPRSR